MARRAKSTDSINAQLKRIREGISEERSRLFRKKYGHVYDGNTLVSVNNRRGDGLTASEERRFRSLERRLEGAANVAREYQGNMVMSDDGKRISRQMVSEGRAKERGGLMFTGYTDINTTRLVEQMPSNEQRGMNATNTAAKGQSVK